MPPLRNQNSKYWCFTINQPTEQDDIAIDNLRNSSSYLIYQLEQGENGTPHYQGYVEFAIRKRGSTIKNLIPRGHIEVRRGNSKQASDYCKKEESRLDGPWESGVLSDPHPGSRNDLLAVKEAIDEGKSLTEISNEHFAAFFRS